jgi:beta-lactamase regulating signal transducer with metallopeptidase domain
MISTSNAVASTIVAAMLNSLVVALILTVGAQILMKFARGMNAATRHVVWWCVLAAVLAIAPARSAVDWLMEASRPPVIESAATPDTADYVTPAAVPMPLVAAEPAPGIRIGYLPVAILALCALTFLIQSARVLWSYLYLRRLKNSGTSAPQDLKLGFDEWVIGCGVKRPVRLLLSDEVASPIAVGFRHPAVIIPRPLVEHMSEADLDHMLLHELAHLARKDDWTNLIARVMWGALALHPLAWWILRRIDEEREVACDDWVVAVTGGAKQYALSLSRLMEFRL